MRYFKFEKEESGKWFVVLPEWTGYKEELEMVCGADIFLDILAQGETSIEVGMDIEPFDGFRYTLTFMKHESGGGDYHLESEFYDFPVWLCHVTKFVFGELPEKIYVA